MQQTITGFFPLELKTSVDCSTTTTISKIFEDDFKLNGEKIFEHTDQDIKSCFYIGHENSVLTNGQKSKLKPEIGTGYIELLKVEKKVQKVNINNNNNNNNKKCYYLKIVASPNYMSKFIRNETKKKNCFEVPPDFGMRNKKLKNENLINNKTFKNNFCNVVSLLNLGLLAYSINKKLKNFDLIETIPSQKQKQTFFAPINTLPKVKENFIYPEILIFDNNIHIENNEILYNKSFPKFKPNNSEITQNSLIKFAKFSNDFEQIYDDENNYLYVMNDNTNINRTTKKKNIITQKRRFQQGTIIKCSVDNENIKNNGFYYEYPKENSNVKKRTDDEQLFKFKVKKRVI